MSTAPPAPGHARPTAARLLAALDALRAHGMGILRRIHNAAMAGPTAPIDTRGFARAGRAVMWAAALGAVITGHLRITTRPTPAHPKPARLPPPQPTGAPVAPPRPARRTSRTLRLPRAMQAAFAKHPIGIIAAGICRDLGVTNASDLWPADILATTLTPAEWSATYFPVNPPTSRRKSATRRPPPPVPTPPLEQPKPPPHWRPPPRTPSHRAHLLSTTTPFSLPFPLPLAGGAGGGVTTRTHEAAAVLSKAP